MRLVVGGLLCREVGSIIIRKERVGVEPGIDRVGIRLLRVQGVDILLYGFRLGGLYEFVLECGIDGVLELCQHVLCLADFTDGVVGSALGGLYLGLHVFPFLEVLQAGAVRGEDNLAVNLPGAVAFVEHEIGLPVGRYNLINGDAAGQYLGKTIDCREAPYPVELAAEKAHEKVVIITLLHLVRLLGHQELALAGRLPTLGIEIERTELPEIGRRIGRQVPVLVLRRLMRLLDVLDAKGHVLEYQGRGGEDAGRVVITKVRFDSLRVRPARYEPELQALIADQEGHGPHPDRVYPLRVVVEGGLQHILGFDGVSVSALGELQGLVILFLALYLVGVNLPQFRGEETGDGGIRQLHFRAVGLVDIVLYPGNPDVYAFRLELGIRE